MKKISFIGAGNMATAIIKGICGSKDASAYELHAYDVMREKAEKLSVSGVHAGTLEKVVSDADFLFLAIKPQNFEEVLKQIKPLFSLHTVVVSIAAGITAEYIQSFLGKECKVVLVMPNTHLLLGYGASALAQVAPTSDTEFSAVCDIFRASGEIAVIPENQMKEIIAVNGSSPAFIYLYAKGFVEYAASVGIDADAALRLFCQTLIGSAEMMLHSGKSIDDLIVMVSSKGGTTIAGLDQLRERGLQDAVQAACEACTKRAYELSKS